MSVVPRFVVVGHVNKGKSSVVAALTEDPTVPVDWRPGTTTRSREHVFLDAAGPCFRLVDTPGFQEAAAALEWLRGRAADAAARPGALRDFVAAFAGGERFRDEVELLRPLLEEDAGILYVVDASRPFRPAHEAEMEVLRWAGRPGMALMNRIGEEDHAEEWRPVLQQFFPVVRDFDAHGVEPRERVELLRTLGALRPEWKAPMERAVARLEAEWDERERQARRAVARFLVRALSAVVTAPLDDDADLRALDRALEEELRDRLRREEEDFRREVERVFGHPPLEGGPPGFDPTDLDPFHEDATRWFGLTPRQLVTRGAAAGAAAGGGVDLLVGGLSFAAGAAIGGALGAAGGWWGHRRLARGWNPKASVLSRLLPGRHGRYRAVGPVQDPNLPWVLLDRALAYVDLVRARSHAARGPLPRDATTVRSRAWDESLRRRFAREFHRVQRTARRGGSPGAAERDALAEALELIPPRSGR